MHIHTHTYTYIHIHTHTYNIYIHIQYIQIHTIHTHTYTYIHMICEFCIYVYVCDVMLYVSDFMCMYVQLGFMPYSKDQYRQFPFTNPSTCSPCIASMHMALGCLRVFDATQNTQDKKIYFNCFGHGNSFILGISRAPQYPDHFWTMFFLVAPFLSGMSKHMMDIGQPSTITQLSLPKTTSISSMSPGRGIGQLTPF